MEKFTESSSIYETFSPFSKVLCCCGFWYNGSRSKPTATRSHSLIKVLLSVMYSSMLCWFSFRSIVLGPQEPQEMSSFLMKHGFHKLYAMELFFLPSFIWSNFYNRKELDECLQLLHRYDVLCQANSNWAVRIDHSRQRKRVLLSTVLMFAWLLAKDLASVVLWNEKGDRLVSLLSSVVCTNITALLIARCVFYFGSFLSRIANFRVNFEHSQLDCPTLDEFANCYSIFESLIRKLNSVFRVQIIVTLFFSLAASTILIFSMVLNLMRVTNTVDQIFIDIGSVMWTFTILIPMFISIHIASSIKDEHDALLSAVSQKLIDRSDELLHEKLLIFYLRLHKPLTVTTELFDFDWSIASSLATATCTYLFILLQFEPFDRAIYN